MENPSKHSINKTSSYSIIEIMKVIQQKKIQKWNIKIKIYKPHTLNIHTIMVLIVLMTPLVAEVVNLSKLIATTAYPVAPTIIKNQLSPQLCLEKTILMKKISNKIWLRNNTTDSLSPEILIIIMEIITRKIMEAASSLWQIIKTGLEILSAF
jgi:hypothetical protein